MSKLKIYCNNLECKYNRKVEKEKHFSFNKINYIPFEDNKILGKCSRKGYDFEVANYSTDKLDYKFAECYASDAEVLVCNRIDCLHNDTRVCSKEDIWVNASATDKVFWNCRCYSQKKISGHMDFMSLLKPDGTSYGGHLSDAEAERVNRDATSFKSYAHGHKEAKEIKPRKSKTK